MFCSRYVGLAAIHREFKKQLVYYKFPRYRGDRLYLYGIARGKVDLMLSERIPNSEKLCQFFNDKGVRAEVGEWDKYYPNSDDNPHYPVGISLRLRKKERPLAIKVLKFIVYSLNNLVTFQRRVVINQNGQLEMVIPLEQDSQSATLETSTQVSEQIPDELDDAAQTQISQQATITAEVHPIQVLNRQGEVTGWSVPSSDPSHEPYTIKYYRGHLSCNCLGYRYGRSRENGHRICQHVRRVIEEFEVPYNQGNGRAVSTRLNHTAATHS